ncbi:hypothetical protein CDAR_533551 [Caerostris darwini]|uniref:Uncharacterized protein n=1 Tax=Caerostris darwini TaxID=1538125 RepID=A0AAV4S5C7_9ARAC|nr:hypothetical protein CDAR_533551 [Caerostris darwini]
MQMARNPTPAGYFLTSDPCSFIHTHKCTYAVCAPRCRCKKKKGFEGEANWAFARKKSKRRDGVRKSGPRNTKIRKEVEEREDLTYCFPYLKMALICMLNIYRYF